jgi:hypothetical protein
MSWIKKSKINLIRLNLKYDSFLSDIDTYQSRLIKIGSEHFIRYKKKNKIYWYYAFIHGIYGDYYHITVDLMDNDKLRNKLNRKYISFNRDYNIDILLEKR